MKEKAQSERFTDAKASVVSWIDGQRIRKGVAPSKERVCKWLYAFSLSIFEVDVIYSHIPFDYRAEIEQMEGLED